VLYEKMGCACIINEFPASTCFQEANRSGRTKEDIQMMNLKKKTRKRTRKFEIDGVVVTTTTSKVIYGDEENGKVYDDHIFRYLIRVSIVVFSY
jgi:STE20-like kinase